MKMTGSPRHRDLWRSHGGSQHGPCVETYTIPEAQFDAFCRSVEAPLLATIDARDAEIVRLREALHLSRDFVKDEFDVRDGSFSPGDPDYSYVEDAKHALAAIDAALAQGSHDDA